jgi:hypothetical protein
LLANADLANVDDTEAAVKDDTEAAEDADMEISRLELDKPSR